MSSQIGTVRGIRVNVEPVDVELDDDNGILWTSLQTAFPGCSGMYYREPNATCKSAVKFDGKKFCPPGGQWNDREYFVTLSQRCHSAQMPFGSYENASKQFERSVDAVQRMLVATMGGESRLRLRSVNPPPSPPSEKVAPSPPKTSTVSSIDPVSSIQERELQLKSSNRKLTPIEQQFVDLAKISTGKDAIIEQQREDIRKLNENLQKANAELARAEQRNNDLQLRINAQEEELKLMRQLGEQQRCVNNQVAELSKAIETRDREIKHLRETLEVTQSSWKKEIDEAKEKFAQLQLKFEANELALAEVNEQLQVALVSRDLLARELDQLRPLAEAVELENPENVVTYSQALSDAAELKQKCNALATENEEIRSAHSELTALQESSSKENTRLITRNQELENRLAHLDEEIRKLNDDWKTRFTGKQEVFDTTHSEAQKEIDSLKEEMASLQRMLEMATRDAAENARRIEDAHRAKEELRRAYEAAEFRHQEPLKREIRNLKEELEESQARVAELTGLVNSLAADAHNIRHDITEIM